MTDIEAKRVRLAQIRDQIAQYENWFHPEPDEVEHLIYLAGEWAAIGESEVSQAELTKHWRDSVFPSLVRFCKDELGRLSEYCERRQANHLPTLSSNLIWIIKQLCRTDSIEEVEEYCKAINHVYVADILARILRTSYCAMRAPSYLTDAVLQQLRGDILEIMARTYADIIEVMRESAKSRIQIGLAQVDNTKKAMNAVRKLSDEDEVEMKAKGLALREKHPTWSNQAIATELHKEYSSLSVSSIRQRKWLKGNN